MNINDIRIIEYVNLLALRVAIFYVLVCMCGMGGGGRGKRRVIWRPLAIMHYSVLSNTIIKSILTFLIVVSNLLLLFNVPSNKQNVTIYSKNGFIGSKKLPTVVNETELSSPSFPALKRIVKFTVLKNKNELKYKVGSK